MNDDQDPRDTHVSRVESDEVSGEVRVCLGSFQLSRGCSYDRTGRGLVPENSRSLLRSELIF